VIRALYGQEPPRRSPQPTLKVDGLKGEDLRGVVALWGYAGEEAYFSNVRITNATPQPLKNGADATGTWQVKGMTDAGPVDGTLQLRREGKTLTGPGLARWAPIVP
jgi:hypothetical protein